ncbi:MAG: gliding motility-associated C-terminal domain-containing protein, partial [Candidatus Latescibacterota bacterium]
GGPARGLGGLALGAAPPAAGVADQEGDSLRVDLPRPVLADSVEIAFQARLLENPTVFSAVVRQPAVAGAWQGVVPRDSEADRVYVPAVYERRSLLHNLVCDRAFTPNGDGINDTFELRLNTIRTASQPVVRLYALDGTLPAELTAGGEERQPPVYEWDGHNPGGRPVPPGIYVLRLQVAADAGDEVVTRLVCVAY